MINLGPISQSNTLCFSLWHALIMALIILPILVVRTFVHDADSVKEYKENNTRSRLLQEQETRVVKFDTNVPFWCGHMVWRAVVTNTEISRCWQFTLLVTGPVPERALVKEFAAPPLQPRFDDWLLFLGYSWVGISLLPSWKPVREKWQQHFMIGG